MTDSKGQQGAKADIIREVMKLSRSVTSIAGISQVSGSFSAIRDPAPGETLFVDSHEFEPRAIQSEDFISIRIKYAVNGLALTLDENGEERVVPDQEASEREVDDMDKLFEIEAVFQADYELNSDSKLSENVLLAFGETNARINITAYWREWVSSCLSRVGLPNYLVPPVNAQSRFDYIKDKYSVDDISTESDQPAKTE